MSDRPSIFASTPSFEFLVLRGEVYRRNTSTPWPDASSGWRFESSLTLFQQFGTVAYPDLLLSPEAS